MAINEEIIADKQNKIMNMILYIIHSSGDLDKFSLCKLLYYTDAYHYQKYGNTITGHRFLHIEQAPIPEGMNEILSYMVVNKMIVLRPNVAKKERSIAMVFDALIPANKKEMTGKEIKTLRNICFLLGKRVQDESRIFPLLYEHYIITDLFIAIDFTKLPKEGPPKLARKRRLVEIGDKIYKILFESN